MLERYEIKKINNHNVLYLYLNTKYEFSKEFNDSELERKATNFLTTHNISFDGNKIVFVINGIKSKEITIRKDKKDYSNDYIVTLKNNEKITIKELLLGLLLSNISIKLDQEVLKAIVILYRSEIINNIEENKYLDLNKINMLYHNYNYYKLTYPESYKAYFKNYNKVIDDTNNEYLTYQDKPIRCYTHLVSNGYTEEDKTIPYTVKKESLWDLAYPNFMQVKNYSIDEFNKKLNITNKKYNIKITSLSNSNRIKEIEIDNKKISSKLLAVILNLPSTDITIIVKKDYLTFITRGIGYGLGLSIIGANNLAELGYNYKQILNYYFKDIVLITK